MSARRRRLTTPSQDRFSPDTSDAEVVGINSCKFSRLDPDRPAPGGEEPAGDRVHPPGGSAGRRCVSRGGAARSSRYLRRRHPRRDAGRGVPRRGDDAGNEFIIGSSAGALLCRYFTGRRHLDAEDQIALDFAGAYPRTAQRLAEPASNDRRDSIRPRTCLTSTGFPMASMSCSTCCS